MTRSQEELVGGMRHVAYEVWMASASAQNLRAAPTNPSVATNATIEAGLIHARVLTEFFKLGGRPHSDDMLPEEFAPAWTPRPAIEFAFLEQNYALLHKHVAHLSWTRSHNPADRVDSIGLMNAAARVGLAWHEHVRVENPAVANDSEVLVAMQSAKDALNDLPKILALGPTKATSTASHHPRGATGPVGP